MNTTQNVTTITTDGACWPNNGSGNGGWAFIIRRHHGQQTVLERGGSEWKTTNNRMELTAILEALRELRDSPGSVVVIRTDSRYALQACTVWGNAWERSNWTLRSKKSRGDPVKNADIIREIRALAAKHVVSWEWVRGHAGDADNERCDAIADEMVGRAAKAFGKPSLPTPAPSLIH